jgi:hypothetical protein
MMNRSLFLLALTLGLLFSASANAQRIPPLPKDYSQVEIFLATRDIGHEVYSKYGHTIVRVLDHKTNIDVAYNWGTFDFEDPGFVPKFLEGILIYNMSWGPWWEEVDISQYELQTMWMEKINLTNKQKETLVRRINWNAQPANVHYPYLFFYDNCSTRVRDLIDEAIHGKVKEATFTRKTGRSYRDRVMEHNASVPIFAMGQDVILNSEPDREMSEWDDMFIPINLRESLLKIPAVDDDGKEIPGVTVLSDTKVLTKFPRPDIPPVNGYGLIWILAGLPAMIGLWLFRIRKRTKLAVRLIGFSELVLGGLWFFFGVFMTLSWVYGSHTVLPRNVNLLLMWPTDVLYLVLGFKLLWRGEWVSETGKFWSALVWNTRAHFAAMAVFLIVSLGHLVTQNATRVALWFVPLTAIVFGIVLLRPIAEVAVKEETQ